LPLFNEMLAPQPAAGRLFTAGDATAMAAAIRSYLAVPGAQRADAALRIAEHYDWKRTVEPLVQRLKSWKASPSLSAKPATRLG
jgi:hypothetical protein